MNNISQQQWNEIEQGRCLCRSRGSHSGFFAVQRQWWRHSRMLLPSKGRLRRDVRAGRALMWEAEQTQEAVCPHGTGEVRNDFVVAIETEGKISEHKCSKENVNTGALFGLRGGAQVTERCLPVCWTKAVLNPSVFREGLNIGGASQDGVMRLERESMQTIGSKWDFRTWTGWERYFPSRDPALRVEASHTEENTPKC